MSEASLGLISFGSCGPFFFSACCSSGTASRSDIVTLVSASMGFLPGLDGWRLHVNDATKRKDTAKVMPSAMKDHRSMPWREPTALVPMLKLATDSVTPG